MSPQQTTEHHLSREPEQIKTERLENEREPYLLTMSGIEFYPLRPTADMIRIEDIAHSLSMQCRYVGHTREFYSVAQHSVIVHSVLWSGFSKHTLNPFSAARYALLHDAAEAYAHDITRPAKDAMRILAQGPTTYDILSEGIQRAILDKFNVRPEPSDVQLIREIDARIIRHEMADLCAYMPESLARLDPLPGITTINPLPPKEARDLFMAAFCGLFNTTN